METNTNKPKICLIEDDGFIYQACNVGLVQAGFIMVGAKDGQAAIDVIKKEKPDLILLDLILPNKNGFEILKEVKMDGNLKNIPIVVFSNLNDEKDKEEVKSLGAIDYFVKSDVSMFKIIERINGLLLK